MDDFLVRLEKQVWAIWLPVVASAALALGFALGTWFANVRQGTAEASSAAQSQQNCQCRKVLRSKPFRNERDAEHMVYGRFSFRS